MEVIQQSPFLPLARALYEAIAALNENEQTASQQSIVDFLFLTYQYVHVPKLNVIHDCLGILIKEKKVYHNGNGYFVSAHNPFDKPKDSLEDNNSSLLPKEPVQCVSKSAKENEPQKAEAEEISQVCAKCEENQKENPASELEHKQDAEVEPPVRGSQKKPSTKKKERGKKTQSNCKSKSSTPKEARKSLDPSEKEKKSAAKEKRRHRRSSNSNSATSETSSSTSERVHKNRGADKTVKENQGQEGKKPKRKVFSQISCLMSKTFSTTDVFQDGMNCSVPREECTPSNPDPDVKEGEEKVAQMVTSNSPVSDSMTPRIETKEENETKRLNSDKERDLQDLRSSVVRSRSFVQASKKRPDPVTRSNSFTANTARAAARHEITTEHLRPDERRVRANYADLLSRSVVVRRSMPPLSRSGGFPVGIVRPLTNSHATDFLTVYRNNSVKADNSRKSSASGTPSSTPRMKEKAAGHVPKSMSSKESPTGFESQIPVRTMASQMYLMDTPLKQLLSSNTKSRTSSAKVRTTVPSKVRHLAPNSRLIPARHPKKTSPRSTVPNEACECQNCAGKHDESSNKLCSSPMCYDKCKLTGEKIEHCKCNLHDSTCKELSSVPGQMTDMLNSQDICLEQVSSSECSDLHGLGEKRYLDVKPFTPFEFTDGESRYDESLTFIGII